MDAERNGTFGGMLRGLREAARWMEQGAEQTFPDGVAFAALAPLGDAALVASAISQALGLQETAARSPLDAVREHLPALFNNRVPAHFSFPGHRLLLIIPDAMRPSAPPTHRRRSRAGFSGSLAGGRRALRFWIACSPAAAFGGARRRPRAAALRCAPGSGIRRCPSRTSSVLRIRLSSDVCSVNPGAAADHPHRPHTSPTEGDVGVASLAPTADVLRNRGNAGYQHGTADRLRGEDSPGDDRDFR